MKIDKKINGKNILIDISDKDLAMHLFDKLLEKIYQDEDRNINKMIIDIRTELSSIEKTLSSEKKLINSYTDKQREERINIYNDIKTILERSFEAIKNSKAEISIKINSYLSLLQR
jgi:hypothetical protein